MQEIKFEIFPEDYAYSRVQTTFPWSREELIADFEQEDWKPYGAETAVKHDAWTGKRYKVHRPKSPKLQKISQFFKR